MLKLGVIGYGKRANDIWAKSMKDVGLVTVAAIADPQIETIKVKYGENLPGCRYYTDAKEMLDNEKLDGVLVATRCNLHTKFARLVAQYDLPLFLEKPVSVTKEELEELETIVPQMNEKTVVCFPLRLSQIVEAVKDIIDRGCIGEIAQVQAYNNVNYARGYYHGWYRDESITGGLFLQKSTHDLVKSCVNLGYEDLIYLLGGALLFKNLLLSVVLKVRILQFSAFGICLFSRFKSFNFL